MSKYGLKRFSYFKLSSIFGVGLDFARDEYNEYRWWECEIHITLGAYYFTVRV